MKLSVQPVASCLAGAGILRFSRGVFLARRATLARAATPAPAAATTSTSPTPAARRRNILFVTTDQQRFDSLGVTSNPYAGTPSIDALARDGLL